MIGQSLTICETDSFQMKYTYAMCYLPFMICANPHHRSSLTSNMTRRSFPPLTSAIRRPTSNIRPATKRISSLVFLLFSTTPQPLPLSRQIPTLCSTTPDRSIPNSEPSREQRTSQWRKSRTKSRPCRPTATTSPSNSSPRRQQWAPRTSVHDSTACLVLYVPSS